MNKPVVLSDLDDTLFQTRRKMVDELALEPFRTGAVDRTLNPTKLYDGRTVHVGGLAPGAG